MKGRAAQHDRFRALISARLDGRLPVRSERSLLRHLAECGACRAVQADYAEQRRLLRALGPASPPRDLWARTSAALDREVLRRPRRPERQRRRVLPRLVVLSSAAAMSVVLVLISSELGLAPMPAQNQPPNALPTPFQIAPQPIAFLASDANGLVLYRTDVDEACPPSAPACLSHERLAPQPIALPDGLRPANMSISPDGQLMAVTGRERGRERIFALILVAEDRAARETPAVPAASPPTDQVSPSAGRRQVSPEPMDDLAPPNLLPSPVRASPLAAGAPIAAPTLAALSLLDDVHTAGAPPAWSPDGDVLAFSAMPADRSHGPDIYVWREGDEVAHPLTTDHGSYFASWAGEQIVASRVVSDAGRNAEHRLTTVVIDIDTGEERDLAPAGLWLPAVSPLGTHAVAWHGQLELDETGVRPIDGTLYLVDWRSLDPLAEEDEVGANEKPSPPPEPSASGQPDAGDHPPTPHAPADGDRGASSHDPAAAHDPAPSVDPAQEAEPIDGTGAAGASPAAPDPGQPSVDVTPGPTSLAEDGRSPAPPVPAESPAAGTERVEDGDPILAPLRHSDGRPVLDWLVRWSSDGRVIGYWLADVPGASWGELTVLAVDPLSGDLADEPLLAPILARRSFTLGSDRVAWVAPDESGVQGSVRITTWGPAGDGGVRLPSLDLREVVLAF